MANLDYRRVPHKYHMEVEATPAEVDVCVVHFSEFSTSSVPRICRLSLPAHAVSIAIRATGAAHGVGDVIVESKGETLSQLFRRDETTYCWRKISCTTWMSKTL